MMHRFLIAALLAVALASPSAASADPGEWFDTSDDSPGRSSCVSKSEERRLVGMTRSEVEALLGWEGYRADLGQGARDYRPCGWSWREGRVTVRYGKAGRVWLPVRLISPEGILVPPSEHSRG